MKKIRITAVLTRWPLLVVLLGNVLAMIPSGFRPTFAAVRRIYNFNTLLLPLLLTLYGLTSLAQHAHKRGKSTRRAGRQVIICLVVSAVLVGLRLYCTHIEPSLLRLRHVTISTQKVDRPIRILHISDIQCSRVGRYEAKAFARMRELNPDLIIHTGDLIQTRRSADFDSELPKLVSLIESLTPPLGLFSVYGDVDWRIANRDRRTLGGMQFLSNEQAIVETGQVRLRLFGLGLAESRGANNSEATVTGWLSNANPEDFTLLFGHAPDYVLGVQDKAIDLCLAGHTHGGQVRIPGIGPIVTMSQVPHSWARGFRRAGRTRLNVSAGVGCEHAGNVPPIRFSCPTEMTLIELVPGKDEPSPETGQVHMTGIVEKITGFFLENLPSLKMLATGGPLSLLWALLCLFYAGYLKRVKRLKTGYTRKVFHFLIFTSAAIVHFLLGSSGVCLFGGMTTLVVFYAVIKGRSHLLYEAMAREKDEPHRTYYIIAPYFATLLGGLTANIFFGEIATWLGQPVTAIDPRQPGMDVNVKEAL